MDKEFKFYYDNFIWWETPALIEHKQSTLRFIKQRETGFPEQGFPMLKTFKLVVDVVDSILEERKTEENANV